MRGVLGNIQVHRGSLGTDLTNKDELGDAALPPSSWLSCEESSGSRAPHPNSNLAREGLGI